MLRLFNTLTRQKEEFKPIRDNEARIYSCGPTVYDYAHIGNMRAFIFADVLKRALLYNGYRVKHIMNLTDVGHLTGDRDMGEDKLQKAAKEARKTAWEIASFYTDAFLSDIEELNILTPDKLPKATDHIKDMIKLISNLGEKGFTYRTSDGVYFDTSKLKEYGKLAKLDIEGLKEGARVEVNPDKKNPTDFALWKFSSPSPSPSPSPYGRSPEGRQGRGKETNSSPAAPSPSSPPSSINSPPARGGVRGGGSGEGGRRDMEWQSPWGLGFPGWHIECSAMSAKYLGQPFDIHTGGVDLIPVHHTNEIAQTEGATGRPLANFWLHSEFLMINGGRIGKSEGNIITIQDLKSKDLSPLAYRFFVLQGHYQTKLNFSWEALEGAQNSLNNLYSTIAEYNAPKIGCAEFEKDFLEAINDDLDTPKALAVVWNLIGSQYPGEAKLKSLLEFDKVLGLSLKETWEELRRPLPDEIKKFVSEREDLRKQGQWQEADKLRKKVESLGFEINDTDLGPLVKRKI